jgi:hypothetical protein
MDLKKDPILERKKYFKQRKFFYLGKKPHIKFKNSLKVRRRENAK